MTPGQVQEAKRLRSEGVLLNDIADRLGVGRSTAWRWCNDYHDRRIGARGVAKRAADDAALRPCPVCGEGRIHRDSQMCRSCRDENRRAPWREIERLWSEGKTIREIAAAIGTTKGCVGATVSKMRADGYDLPYRRTPEHRERMLVGSDERLALARARKLAA